MAIDEMKMTADVQDQMQVHFEVERFYFQEANLLDDRLFEEWVALFSDDAHYFMPIRRTRSKRELDKEFTQPGQMAFFDDTKMLLEARVRRSCRAPPGRKTRRREPATSSRTSS